jgi:hypothetical protein
MKSTNQKFQILNKLKNPRQGQLIKKKLSALHSTFYALFSMLFLLMVSVWGNENSNYSPQEQERVLEEVEVVNVLVPVRVFQKGIPVEGLQIKDFQLYEDGKLKQINTFQVISRQIKSDKETTLYKKKKKSRFFVLIFNIFDFNQDVARGIDTFFNTIYRETDRVVIITPDRTFDIDNSREMIRCLPVLKKILSLYSMKAKNDLNRVFKRLEEEVNQFFQNYFVDQATKVFLSNYKRIWDDYVKKYLIPDVKKFYWFADVLKNIQMEKWVIVFQQREVFPQFSSFSRIEQKIRDWITGHFEKPTTPLLEQMLQKLKYSFKVSKSFPLQEIQEAFFRANATFHVLLFRSHRTAISQDFDYSETVSDYENSFRAISRATGGDVILTNKLQQSLEKVSERKDVYYILSYAPEEKHNKDRKIKVKVTGNGGYDIFYIKKLKLNPQFEEEKKISQIDVTGFTFKNKRLKVSLVNYLRNEVEGKKLGLIEVRVMVMREGSEEVVYDKSNVLQATRAEIKLEIPFLSLDKGKYYLIIDLTDKLTNKSKIFTQPITI